MRAIPDRNGGGAATAICVLGPGRAGTALTARLLGLAGVYLGAERELLSRGGIPANPKGFWEHRGLSRINQRIFERLGGSWSEPPPLPSGWQGSELLAREREDARAQLAESFDGRSLWGWKDARNSLTLPFWRPLLAERGCRVRYVVCLRNPLDVAASLEPPSPLTREQRLRLWQTYVASALANTAGAPRHLVAYESYFADFEWALGRLLSFAGCETPAPGTDAAQRMREFLDEALWRHRSTAEEAIDDPALPEESRSLYLIVSLFAVADPAPGLAAAVDAYARLALDRVGGR